VISKYIAETEENLMSLFAATGSGPQPKHHADRELNTPVLDERRRLSQ
jgi:hypothetical protein